jgi:hypothetical protein
MNELDKNQDKAGQTDDQGKPAFDQFEKGQGQQQEQQDEPAGADKGAEGGQQYGQKGEELEPGRQQQQDQAGQQR